MDYLPSEFPPRYLDAAEGRRVILHAMHSVTDWFAYAIWENGTMVRSLCLSPDNGIAENIGDLLPFEAPFWAGEHPAGDRCPLPFHPLELGGGAALRALFGFIIEGRPPHSSLRRRGAGTWQAGSPLNCAWTRPRATDTGTIWTTVVTGLTHAGN